MSEIRIKDLPETLDVDIGDYVAVDNEGDGVRRYNLKHLVSSTSAPEFVIHVDSSLVSDKTFLEASEAIANGYVPVVIYDTRYYTLTKVTDSKMTFSVVDSYTPATIMEVVLHNGSGTTVETTTITSSSINNWSNVPGDKITDALNDLSSNVTYITNDMTTAKGDIESLDSRVTALENEGGSSGGGLTQTEKNLILSLFSKAPYLDDVDIVYSQLEALWATSEKTITYNLTNVGSSNNATTIESGSGYATALSTRPGYTLNYVTVTMGGVDVTLNYYSSGSITIPIVTGDIIITATAVISVTSITATYTQSGTVYDTDTLDSLKSDLVVTANYSDGTSETVTDYTLSGTLAEGTSTITVTYGGKTASFNVTVSATPVVTASPSKKTIPSLNTTTGLWQTTTSSGAAYCGFLFDESMTGGTISIDWDTDDHSILDVIVTAETDTAWSGIRTHTQNNATYGMNADVTGFSSAFYWYKFAEYYQANSQNPTVYQPTANTGHATVNLPEGYKAFLVSIRRNSNSTSVNELATDNTSFNNWAAENVTVTVRGGVINE